MRVALIERLERRWDSLEKKVLKRLDSRQKKMWNAFIFLVKFNLLALPLHFLLWSGFDATALQEWTAMMVAPVIRALGPGVTRESFILVIKSGENVFMGRVIKDCVGWKSVLALSGLAFAVRDVKLKRKLRFLAWGIPVLLAGNVLRLATTFYAGAVYGPEAFALVHEALWQWGLIGLILALWYCWLCAETGKNRRK